MEYAQAKGLLTPLRGSMEDFFYADWNMNLYRGCSHGCIYCDSRSLCYHLDHFDQIRPKQDALLLLEKEVRSKRKTGVVTMGAMSDPYNPLEENLHLTRGALEILSRYGFGASYTTKSALCARDADLLAAMSRYAPASARITITCADDGLCRKIEPNVSPTSERLEALHMLSTSGLHAGVWLNPVLPFLTDSEENIRRVVELSAKAGAKFVVCFFGMTLRHGNREYYFQRLEESFPGVRSQYLKTYGNAYECTVLNARKLYEVFTDTCRKHGLAWRFADINRDMMRPKPQQLSLWD